MKLVKLPDMATIYPGLGAKIKQHGLREVNSCLVHCYLMCQAVRVIVLESLGESIKAGTCLFDARTDVRDCRRWHRWITRPMLQR